MEIQWRRLRLSGNEKLEMRLKTQLMQSHKIILNLELCDSIEKIQGKDYTKAYGATAATVTHLMQPYHGTGL